MLIFLTVDFDFWLWHLPLVYISAGADCTCLISNNIYFNNINNIINRMTYLTDCREHAEYSYDVNELVEHRCRFRIFVVVHIGRPWKIVHPSVVARGWTSRVSTTCYHNYTRSFVSIRRPFNRGYSSVTTEPPPGTT